MSGEMIRRAARRLALVAALGAAGAVVATGGAPADEANTVGAVQARQLEAALAAVDTSKCPGDASGVALRENLLEPPEVEDELEDNPPTIPEIPEAQGLALSQPNQNLKPTLRAPNAALSDAPAAAEAGSSAVEIGLRWCVVQPTSAGFNWAACDETLQTYGAAGVAVRTIRVVDAPKWAVTTNCWNDAQQSGGPKMCPSMANRDSDLRAFARETAARYGPGSTYGVDRLSFWNEPNIPKNWGAVERGGDPAERDRARRYSDRLAVFSTGATQGDAAIKIDAGEVAAGSDSSKGNGARKWAKEFADYNTDQNRNEKYDVLTIHAYSEFASQIPKKVKNYRALSGVRAVGVTEFGWAVGNGAYKCVGSDAGQGTKFDAAVQGVRASDAGVHRLVWFSVIDNRKRSAVVKCPDSTNYYNQAVKNETNTYGLYRRHPDGTLSGFGTGTPARLPLRNAFQAAQSP